MDTDAYLARLSSERWSVVCDALRDISEEFRRSARIAVEAKAIIDKLEALSHHQKWEVRKATAHTLNHARGKVADRTLMRLQNDENGWVRKTAQAALRRRSDPYEDVLTEQHGDLMVKWLSELELRHGQRARLAAQKVADKYTQLILTEMRHEVVKTVAPINLILEKMSHSNDESERQAMIDKVKSKFEQVMRIVDSVLSLHTTAAGVVAAVNVDGLIDELVQNICDRTNVDEKSISLDVDVCVHVSMQRGRIMQALENVVENAIESYSDASAARVLIRAYVADKWLYIQIVDYGSGMSEEACRDSIKLYSTTKRGGAGVGLALTKHIVESEHNGALEVHSLKGSGTTVTMMIPIEGDDD